MEDETLQEASEQEVEAVKDILRNVVKSIKTFNAYPKDNPIYQKTADAIFEKFSEFLNSKEDLSLEVEHNSLSYKGKNVWKSEEKTDNIAIHLYADGIRNISFQKGITKDELLDFIEILRLAPKSNQDEDDIVTKLWEKNIRNMSYSAVEDTVDEELIIEESLLQSSEEGKEEQSTTLHGATYSSLTVKPVSLSIKTEPLTSEELDSLREEMFASDEQYLVSSVTGLFFELLLEEKDITAFAEIVKNLGRIIDMKIKAGDILGISNILRMLKKVSMVSTSSEQAEIIGNVFKEAGSLETLRKIFKHPVLEELHGYLILLDTSAIRNMLELLGEIEDRKHRRLLCDVLAEIGKEHIEELAEFLKDPRWYVVRNIVMILGMMKEPAAIKHIEKAFSHPDVRVRRECIKALENIGTPEIKRLFLSAVNDMDQGVRILALKALKSFGDKEIFGILKENATKERLKKKPFSEKKELLEALAVLGGEDAFPLLSGLFKKKGIFEKDDSLETRAAAAYGLGLIGMKDAEELLKTGLEAKKSLLRDACQRALASRKTMLRGSAR